MYITRLVNFNRNVYQGTCLDSAMAAAMDSGFECAVEGYGMTMTWSPVWGWRMLHEMA